MKERHEEDSKGQKFQKHKKVQNGMGMRNKWIFLFTIWIFKVNCWSLSEAEWLFFVCWCCWIELEVLVCQYFRHRKLIGQWIGAIVIYAPTVAEAYLWTSRQGMRKTQKDKKSKSTKKCKMAWEWGTDEYLCLPYVTILCCPSWKLLEDRGKNETHL